MTKITENLTTIFLAAGILCAACGARAAEQVAAFTVQPRRCIALNRGQVCYQKLAFEWQTAADSRYCLHQDEVLMPLVCWNGAERSSYDIEFASDRNIIYRIRREGQADDLAQVEVEVAWVYQSNRKSFSRWRLF